MVPEIAVLSTGGTIASTGGEDGAVPDKYGEELIGSVPEIEDYGELTVEDVARTPSYEMDVGTVSKLRDRIGQIPDEGAEGIVVTHGTDTMEESAYFVDATTDVDVPVVFTGAQRRPDEISPDGPANLLAAMRSVTHDRVRAAGGVYIAFDMELHAARDVTKRHTSALDTFSSPDKGPVASLTRETIRFHREPGSRVGTIPVDEVNQEVTIVKSAVGRRGKDVRSAVEDDVDGIVVEGTGLGNVTAPIGRAIVDAIDAGVPVVITSRCYAGSTSATYGSDGGGRTLVEHGAIPGGDLSAQKARIRLMLSLETADDSGQVREYF